MIPVLDRSDAKQRVAIDRGKDGIMVQRLCEKRDCARCWSQQGIQLSLKRLPVKDCGVPLLPGGQTMPDLEGQLKAGVKRTDDGISHLSG